MAALCLLVCLVCAWFGLPPTIEPNLMALLPDDEPAAASLRALHADEGGVNLLTIAVDGPAEARSAAMADLKARFDAMPDVRWALHEVEPSVAQQIGLLQLDPESVAELSARVRGAVLLGPAMNPMMAQRLLDLGPKAEGIRRASDLRWLPGAGDERDRLLVRPAGSSMDPQFAQRFMDQVDVALEAVREGHPRVEIPWVGGAYRHNVEDMRGIRADIASTSGASLALVLVVLVVAFRGWRAPLLVFIPLVAANVVNLALVAWWFGGLNTYTSFGTALLVGLGIDFAIHLVGRARERLADGASLEDAIVQAWDLSGPPCTTAALTSAAGFLALSAADFRGFSQLGVLLASGLVLCLVAMLVGLPLLMPWLERDVKPLFGTDARPHSQTSTYALAPLGLMVAVLVTGWLGAAVVPQLGWEYDSSALRRDGLAYAELTDDERALVRSAYTPVIIRYTSAEARDQAAGRVRRAIDDLDHIDRVVSVADVLPADQERRLRELRELQSSVRHPNARYLPPPLLEQLAPLREASLEALAPSALPLPLRDLLGVGRVDDHWLLVFPAGNMWDLREMAALEAELHEVVGDAPTAGEYVALGAMFRHMQADMPRVAFWAVSLVALLCAIDLRRPHWVITVLGTLFAGMVWAGAALHWAGVRLTVMNIVGVPILLGIGVDMIVHLLHRLADEGPGGVRRALATTGVAALVSTLTTIMSFLSLTAAGSRGIRSMGMLVVVGLIAVFVATAVVLPTAWAAGWKVTGRAPADGPRLVP